MANESKKDFNQMMNNSKDMPKVVEMDEKAAKKWGGKTMVIAPPIEYNEIIKKIPTGKLTTTNDIRKYVAKKHKTDITCPLTCGIFINIVAWASYQRKEDETPYWRVLKADGELNVKYPEAYELQKNKLISEGHTIVSKASKNGTRYFVKDYEKDLIDLK